MCNHSFLVIFGYAMMTENEDTGEIRDPLGQQRCLHSPRHTGALRDSELTSNVLSGFSNKISAQ